MCVCLLCAGLCVCLLLVRAKAKRVLCVCVLLLVRAKVCLCVCVFITGVSFITAKETFITGCRGENGRTHPKTVGEKARPRMDGKHGVGSGRGADFYLPAVPPAALRPFTLHVLAENRVVGSALRRTPIHPHNNYQTGMRVLSRILLHLPLPPDRQTAQHEVPHPRFASDDARLQRRARLASTLLSRR